MSEILGVQYQDSVVPWLLRIVETSRKLAGSDCIYPVGIPELRGAIVPPTPTSDADGVFMRIIPTAQGATIQAANQDFGEPIRIPVDSETLPDILRQLEPWISYVRAQMKGQSRGRNPAWTKDELILALDLYFRVPPYTVNSSHPSIHELSEVLGRLAAHTNPPDAVRYRNPNGVYMKLMNLQSHDPERGGRGLSGGGKLEAEIWEEFGSNRDELFRVANSIRQAIADPDILRAVGTPIPLDVEEAVEGYLLTRVHQFRERDRRIVQAKKRSVLKKTGKLACEVCSFDFAEVYGELGEEFIECHHTVPLHTLDVQRKTLIDELALVCANCHRMIHRRKKWLPIVELRSYMTSPARTL